MITKWDYLVLNRHDVPPLEDLGDDGWELICVDAHNNFGPN